MVTPQEGPSARAIRWIQAKPALAADLRQRQSLHLADVAHVNENCKAAMPFWEIARFCEGAPVGSADWPSRVPAVPPGLED